MVLHPDQERRTYQAEFLAKCPEGQKRFHELLFSYGNSAYIYHQQADDFEPQLTDYEEWLEGIPEEMRKDMRQKGFEACKTVLSFTRYVMEKNDVGLAEFVKNRMGSDDYEQYLSFCKND